MLETRMDIATREEILEFYIAEYFEVCLLSFFFLISKFKDECCDGGFKIFKPLANTARLDGVSVIF